MNVTCPDYLWEGENVLVARYMNVYGKKKKMIFDRL